MESQAEYHKNRRAYLKSVHRCIQCAMSLEESREDYLCLACRMARRESDRYYRERGTKKNNPEQVRAAVKRLEKKRIEIGICIKCGKRKPREGSTRCEWCIQKDNRQARERRRKAKEHLPSHGNGICKSCYNPVVDGYKYCEHHLELARKALAKGRQCIKKIGDDRYWIQLNKLLYRGRSK